MKVLHLKIYAYNYSSGVFFFQRQGFVWDIAPDFGAMVVFAEHRYYGKSLPYGQDSLKVGTVQ